MVATDAVGMAARSSVDLDELVEHWTVLEDERDLVEAKYGATRLGFALMLKHYTRYGRFPVAGELPVAVVEFVARQLKVAPGDVESFEWTGRSSQRHRAQIRESLGFRECSVDDGAQLTAWLAEHVAHRERRPERVREEMLVRCRSQRIEPPSPGRIERVVRSALHASEAALCARVVSRQTQVGAGAAVAGKAERHPGSRPRRTGEWIVPDRAGLLERAEALAARGEGREGAGLGARRGRRPAAGARAA